MTKRKRPDNRPPLGKVEEVSGQPGNRTEEQILLQEPFEVTLAGKPVTIKLLPIRPAAEWRKKFVPLFAEFAGLAVVDSDAPDAFRAGMMAFLVDKPRQMLDLFFQYAVDLDRDEIENTANDWELAAAFKLIVEAVLSPPLLTVLTGTLTKA